MSPALPPATAFVILKAHSARVPGKNWRALGGRPLFHWILQALEDCPAVGRVVLDTDARGLLRAAGVGAFAKVELVDRQPALRGDTVSANALIAANLDRLGPGPLLMTHATSPFLRPETLAAALARFAAVRAAGSHDTVFGASRVQARFWTEGGAPVNHDPAVLLPTQELPPWYEENSTLYAFDRAAFVAGGGRMGTRPLPFPTPRLESIDIDTETDWALADVVARGLGAQASDGPRVP